MSLEQIQQMLKAHDISPNKLLGQNFMFEPVSILNSPNTPI
jgi:hypothetical protein